MSQDDESPARPPRAFRAADGLADVLGPIPTFPPRALDDRGRLIPLSAEERRARSDAIRRVLDAIQAMPDTDPPGIDLEIMRGMNESKPERPPFPELL